MMATAFSSSSRTDNNLSPALSCVGEKRRRNESGGICNIGNRNTNRRTSIANGYAERGEHSNSECVALKFNDFGKMREQVNFAVGQTWALYDKLDGMPRLYAQIRKVSAAPSFGLRITYLEPDPHDEKEIQWFEQDLPVSVGKFRLGKNKNINDCCKFSHLIQCSEGKNDDHFGVSPRKGETWAVFKNWDFNWSSEPDSHRKYEYELVEILTDYTDGAGVSVAFLHKAKGFASVFFRMGSTEAEITQILPQSLYRFSHPVPSFKMSGIKGKGVPKDAYELDQAALPQTVEEIIIPPHLLEESISKSIGVKFNDFGKLREELNFAVGQTWALYDPVDGMPRLYAQIRKVSAPPSFGLRITNLEPLRYDGSEIRSFEADLLVSASKFRLGKNQNMKDHSKFSHLIQCNEESYTGHLTVFPQKGETWALFKNWEIKWFTETDFHRKYEYEVVEVLSDYDDKTGVYVASLHKAKGFASVYFRMGTGDDIFRILPCDLSRFSHQVPSFKITETKGKGVPKDAYELDQAAVPETIEEISIPPHILEETETERTYKFQTIYFASNGKVFQTGQIWSFCCDSYDFPLYYGRIQKITCTQVLEQEPVYKLHINRLKSTPFPDDVIQYEDKKMPVGCGTFYARKVLEIITIDDILHQIVPQTSNDGKHYTILPKIGDVWVIYRFWSACSELEEIANRCISYDIVEILDDSLDYKVQLLERESVCGENEYKDEYMFFKEVTEYKYNEIDGSEPIFTIPRSERHRFSHKAPASRVTKEKIGELIDLTKVDSKALPYTLRHGNH